MPKLKLTKTAADAARPETVPCELRDTILPGFSLKVTPTGRKIFMVANVANDGQRHKPARGRIGEITVEQAHGSLKIGCAEDRSQRRALRRASGANGQGVVRTVHDRILPGPEQAVDGRIQSRLWETPHHSDPRPPQGAGRNARRTNANRVPSTLCKMFNLAEVWGLHPTGQTPAGWTAFGNRIRLFGRSGQMPPPRAEVESAADAVEIGIENRRDIECQQLGE